VLSRFLDEIAAALLPGTCPCGVRAEPICRRCAALLRPAPAAPPPAGIAWWTAAYAYEGVARELVARAKYRGARVALTWLADELARCCRARVDVDIVTWVPASNARRHAQGVDHGALLAHGVARRLGLPARARLVRASSHAQTGAPLVHRRTGPEFRARGVVAGESVLVVDDVATTGASLAAAARALRGAGCGRIDAATATRTPQPGRS
jgi:predicted amidophosphoribosyltransferase